ncbi:MAG TPA: FIST N-terminal domain-containing protein [Acidimicrobiales bacterium]
MPFASALSEHPIATEATGEVAGAVLETLGERPDLVLVCVTPPHSGALEDIVAAVDAVLHPLAMIGCAAESVLGTGREVEESAAISLWAARLGPLLPVSLHAVPGAAGDRDFTGWPEDIPFEPQALLLIADPFTFPTEDFLAWMGGRAPGLPIVGGNASAARGPGGNRIAFGARTVTSGAAGVLIGSGVDMTTIVSQGCRPYGSPLTVTRAEGNVIYELAGRPTMERLIDQIKHGLSVADVANLESGGLHLGRVIDEHRSEFGPGDFLVRNVVGVDRTTGAVAVNDEVPVGTTVQFHVRDADTADEDLRALLAARHGDGALVFTCNGRGERLFDQPDHDAAVVSELVGPVPTAGFFAAGEFGPIGGSNFVHGFTAAIALFRDR